MRANARFLLLLCTVVSTLTCSWAFSVVGRTQVSLSQSCAKQSPLFSCRAVRRASSPLFSSPDDNAPATLGDNEDDDDDEVEARGGILKILFISVPLFCKFCIVLIVKFLTDLVVYPLLWLYRLAHLTKCRILKLFGINSKKKTSSREKT